MAKVHLSGEAKRLARGAAIVEVEATTVRALIDRLDQMFPGMRLHLSDGTSVAVDGEIMPNADFVQVESDTEVHFLPAIGGGADREV